MFNFFKKKKSPKKPLIEIWSQYRGLEEIDLIRPVWGMKNHLPDWFDKMPRMMSDSESLFDKVKPGTIKTCPGLAEFFSEAVIIPLWTDTILACDSEGNYKFASSARDQIEHTQFNWEMHGFGQMLQHAPSWVKEETSCIFKATCPWLIKTPPGYSVMQLPMFYHFNRNWTVMPGVIRSDIYHEMNQQVMLHTKHEETMIRAGTPLAMYVPFRREEYDFEVRESTSEDFKSHMTARLSKLTFQQGYRSILQKQQKNIEDAKGTLGRKI